MSSQKFSAAEREAFYQAHGGKCAYTRQPLDMSSFHIEHILPEALSANASEFSRLKAELNLDETFSINGYENLVPVAPGPNLQKGKSIFDPEFCRFYLALAASKKSGVLDAIEKIQQRNTRGKVLVLLQEALESGKLNGVEIAQLLDQYSGKPEDIFSLQEAIEFANEDISEIAKGDIQSLRDRSVLTPGDVLWLDHPTKGEISVLTCREYDRAIRDGYYASSSYAIKGASIFEHRSGLLNCLERARPATVSYIECPRAGIVDLHLLPFQLFPQLSQDATSSELAGTYQDKVNQGEIVVDAVRQNFLRVSQPSGGMGQQLIEVARSDFNGDGIEEILLFEYMWALSGTFGAGGIRILTRRSSDGFFEEVSLNEHGPISEDS